MPLRIGHIIPYASRLGGYERQGLLLAKAMAETGYHVSVLTHEDDARCIMYRSRAESRSEGFISNQVSVIGVRSRGLGLDVSAIHRFVQSVDVIHAHALDRLTGSAVKIVSKEHRRTIVKIATTGDVDRFAHPRSHWQPSEVNDSRSWPITSQMRKFAQQNRMKQAWKSLKHADYFIALNHAIHNELQRNGVTESRIRMLPNAVVLPTLWNTIKPGSNKALYVGRLASRKRVSDLITAFEFVAGQLPDAELIIVGDGPERDVLESQAKGLHVGSDRIRFIGSAIDPAKWLQNSDLFVFASECEGCPNALLEAAAAGLPCLATDIEGVRDWFRHDVDMRLVPPGDLEVFGTEWVRLLNDPELRGSFGQSARNRVAEIAGLEMMCQRYIQLYQE